MGEGGGLRPCSRGNQQNLHTIRILSFLCNSHELQQLFDEFERKSLMSLGYTELGEETGVVILTAGSLSSHVRERKRTQSHSEPPGPKSERKGRYQIEDGTTAAASDDGVRRQMRPDVFLHLGSDRESWNQRKGKRSIFTLTCPALSTMIPQQR